MAVSIESPSSSPLNKDVHISMRSSSTHKFSPSSEKNFWSALRNRVDTLLENRRDLTLSGDVGESGNGKGAKEDCLLLLRGFDSISASLSHLTNNLDTALQGARDLAKPSLTEVLHNDTEKPECDERNKRGEKRAAEGAEENQRAGKRKLDSHGFSDDEEDLEQKEEKQKMKTGKLKNAKNLAVSMATKAASLARELKSIKSDLSFMQDRCQILEEENMRLREGHKKGMRPEEDDLVRLQLEALLAEKSRLANENANLTRENQCLHQLVEYHQLTSQDLSASYEQLITGMCLDFDAVSPPRQTAEDRNNEDQFPGFMEAPWTPQTDIFGFSSPIDEQSEQM